VDLQGYAPAEVAVMTDTKPATVRVHLHKARAAVRARLLAADTWPPLP
jgi:DNA-directed RNA polymerase specialized sigma24 family protein